MDSSCGYIVRVDGTVLVVVIVHVVLIVHVVIIVHVLVEALISKR